MGPVLDAKTSLHILKHWALERVENRQSVELVTSDYDIVIWSPCPSKGEDGWREFHIEERNNWSRDNWDSKDRVIESVNEAVAIIVNLKLNV